jgi:hypothetical protein
MLDCLAVQERPDGTCGGSARSTEGLDGSVALLDQRGRFDPDLMINR